MLLTAAALSSPGVDGQADVPYRIIDNCRLAQAHTIHTVQYLHNHLPHSSTDNLTDPVPVVHILGLLLLTITVGSLCDLCCKPPLCSGSVKQQPTTSVICKKKNYRGRSIPDMVSTAPTTSLQHNARQMTARSTLRPGEVVKNGMGDGRRQRRGGDGGGE